MPNSTSMAEVIFSVFGHLFINEIYIVLGLYLLMGIVQKPTVRSYFSTRRVISTPGFSDVISRERFEII
jgi:hypothetical protein